MKVVALMLLASLCLHAHAQDDSKEKKKWRITKNKAWTGGLVFIAGSAKGFNETLQFNYRILEKKFPGINDQWFDPKISWRNKYEGGNPDNGPKFFLSTSVLVMFTDQYHLNQFIHRSAMVSALIIKLGEGKRPFKHYVYDLLYYTACYQAGFSLMYYPFTSRKYK